MYFGDYPATFGYIIADLKPGDEIIIKAGAGYPEKDVDAIDIVVEVDGMSGLTATGIRLMCSDGAMVKPTGNHFEMGSFEIGPEARTILAKVHSQEIATD